MVQSYMGDKQSDYSDYVDRRKFMKAAGAMGAAALAGCSGSGSNDKNSSSGGGNNGGNSGNNGGTSSSNGGGSKVYDTSFKDVSELVPKNIQFNPFNPNKYSQIAFQLMTDVFARYDYASQKFIQYGISDWKFESDKATLTLRDGLTWFDGSPVTSKDLVTQFKLQKHVGNALWQYADSVEAKDKQTVVIHLQGTTNPKIVRYTVAGNYIRIQDKTYGKYLDKIENASGEDAKNKAIADLTNYAPKQNPVGNGVFKFESADKQTIKLTRNPKHPDAKNINFKTWEADYIGGNQEGWSDLLSNTVDAAYSLFTPPKIVKKLPKNWHEGRFSSYWGYGLVPNFKKEPFNKRAFRQGLMFALNRDDIVKNAGPRTKVTPKIPCGIAAEVQDTYLGDQASKFETYGKGQSMTDKATAKFNEAGLSKSGGKWKYNGKTVSIPVLVPSGWSDWVTATQTIVDQLKSAGFNASMDGKDFGTVSGNWANGDFTLAAGYWLPGGVRSSYPYFPLSWLLTPSLSSSGNTFKWGYEPSGSTTVPSRSGSGTTSVDTKAKTKALSHATDSSKAKEIIQDLAWVVNQELTMLPLLEKQEQTWISGKRFNVPSDDSAYKSQWPSSWLVRQGKITYPGN